MSRQTIQCPGCGRELFNLRRPQCVWCGARIAADQFEQVAAPPQLPSQFPPLMPPPPAPFSGYSRSLFGLNPFRLIRPSNSPWERKMRIAGAALAAALLLTRLVFELWEMWRMHQTLSLLR